MPCQEVAGVFRLRCRDDRWSPLQTTPQPTREICRARRTPRALPSGVLDAPRTSDARPYKFRFHLKINIVGRDGFAAAFSAPSDEGAGFLRSKKTEGERSFGAFVISPSDFASLNHLSLRLGHARVLTIHRTVIHCARAASLPRQREARSRSRLCVGTGAPIGSALGVSSTVRNRRTVIHYRSAASLPAVPHKSLTFCETHARALAQ